MIQWAKKHFLLLAAGAILLLMAIASPNTMRITLTLPLILFLPGYALTIILFKRSDLGTPERLLLSFGLSVSLTALVALILHWTPWGLTLASLRTAFLAMLAFELVVIAMFRRPHLADAFRLPERRSFSARQWILFSLAAVVTLTAFYIARTPVPQQGFEGYTTLWIQPTDQPDLILLGVDSEEFQTTRYQIRFEFNGGVQDGPIFELEPGATWQSELRLPVGPSADKELKVLLYHLDRPNEIYRHAVWWLE